MLPIKLTLQGFNSYQSRQTIDFSPLIQSKIFGIFGEVGSGKSSILEAISFVLYGRVEKMKSALNYNLMNLKSDRFIVDYEFEAANNKYRFLVEGRRNSRNFDNVVLKRKKYIWQNEEWLPDENLKAEKILGLSYENFKRTIIIPQGKFMDFIQLGEADRTKMLKEIFNLQKYDLLDKVGHLQKINNEEIANLEGKLEQFADVTQKHLAFVDQKIDEYKTTRLKTEQSLDNIESEFAKADKVKKDFEDFKSKEEIFKNLQDKKRENIAREEELSIYEKCQITFKSLVENNDKLNKKYESATKTESALKNELATLRQQLTAKKKRFDIVKSDFENIDNHKKKSEELDIVISIKNTEKDILLTSGKLKESKQKLDDISKNKKQISIDSNEMSAKINNLEKELPDIGLLSEISKWFEVLQSIKQGISGINTNITNLDNSLEEALDKKQKIIPESERASLKINTGTDINEVIEDIKSKIDKYDAALKSLLKEKEELVVKTRLKDYSLSLKDGSPCPVCGSTHHPQPIQIEHLDNDIANIKDRISKGEKIIEKLRDFLQDFYNLKSNLENLKNLKQKEKTKLKLQEEKLLAYTKTYKWNVYSPESKEEIDNAHNLASKLFEKLKGLRKEKEILLQKERQTQDDLDKFKETHTKLEDKISSLLATQQTLLGQLKVIPYSDYIKKTIDQINEEKQKSIETITNLEQAYNSLTNEINTLQLQEKGLETQLSGNEKSLNELKAELIQEQNTIERLLQQNNFESVEKVKEILAKNLNIEVEKKEIEKFKIHYKTTKNELESLKVKLKNKKFDIESYEKLKDEIQQKKLELKSIDNEIGGLTKTKNQLEVDLKTKKKFEKELESKLLRRENLKTMRSLFTGNGFVNYISTVRLQEVVNYANSRFIKLTKGSMKLELTKDNSFNIIDFLNGGKTRSIRTLSGGQTFQASLSLALALASTVQQQSKSERNFFFLDEGFGTQDEESMRLVFNAIKDLRKENRTIGLISHVSELKEEINTFLEVVKDDREGSKIVPSWQI